jgi:hypothetical protein
MRQNTQDFSARRVTTTTFDCEPPPDVRAELLKPRRARMLRPLHDRAPYGRLILLALIVVLLAVSGLIALWHQGQTAERAKTNTAILPPALAPQPTPAPVLSPTRIVIPQAPSRAAPKARLVLYKRWADNGVWELVDSTGRTVKILVDPAPRAQLASYFPAPAPEPVQSHEPQIGQAYSFTTPYDSSFNVVGVFRGYLSDLSQLPRTNMYGSSTTCRGFGSLSRGPARLPGWILKERKGFK